MRSVLALLAVSLLLAVATRARADLKLLDQPLWVFPGQPFRIALEQPAGSGELKVEFPDSVEMYDAWDKDSIQRFYFRALAVGDALLRFAGAGGELELTVQVIPWSSLHEAREYQGVQLPRIWPMGEPDFEELKARRTCHTEEELQGLRESGGKPGDRAQAWVEMSDEEVWSIIPGPAIPRTCLIVLLDPGGSRGKGCPVCGTEIYEGRSGFYPWVFDAVNHPWKVGCPSCGNWFPSNDWHLGDMHSGPFPDDGFGCEPVEPVVAPNGTPWRWPFIAYYHQWQAYMNTFTPGAVDTARAFALTGDARYAHRAAIALFRWAESYLDMSVNLNHRKRTVRDGIPQWPVGAPRADRIARLGGSFSYIQPNWDTPRMEQAARAWDLIFDQIEGDEELLRFCQEHHHPEVQTAEDFRRFVEAGLIRATAQMGLDNAVSRNWPMQEAMVATMSLALGTPRSMELTDWVLNGGGAIRYSLTNEYFKDGSGHESEGYNNIQIRGMDEILGALELIREVQPDLYKPPKFVSLLNDPKYRQMYDFVIDNSLIGRTITGTGDGGAPTTNVWPPMQGHPADRSQFANVYRLTRGPRFAQVLYGPDGRIPGALADPELRQEAERLGQELGWQVELPSNILDGFGHAILRSGEGDFQRALWVRYGRVVQHRHPDMLTYGLEALRRKMLPELGYPIGWTYAGVWESNWGTHYGTHITGVNSYDFGRGALELFADAPPARVAKAVSVTMSGDQPRPRRERVIVLVDLSEADCYAVTLERVFGGAQHTWSFHGPDGEATAFGVELAPQGGGTIAGPDSEYRDDSAIRKADGELACLAFMPDPSRGRPDGVWGLDYLLRNQDGVHLRMTSVHPADGELATAACKAPGGASPYEITWAVLQREAEQPLSSQFLNVLEPYEGERLVGSIEPVPVTGGAEGPFPPLALRVTTDEFADTLVFQPSPGVECATADGLTTDAEFAFWRERGGKLVSAVLAHGSRLSKAGLALALAQTRYLGEIEACDWANRKIAVRLVASPDDPFPAQEAAVTTGNNAEHAVQEVQFVGLSRFEASALVGRHVRLTNAAGSEASYTIQQAQPTATGVELTLNLDPRIGEAPVASAEDGAVLGGVGFRLASWGYYAGKHLANEDASAVYRLRDVEGGSKCVIDAEREGQVAAAALHKQFADQDGDALARLVIYDYGPGDTVTIECWASVSAAR